MLGMVQIKFQRLSNLFSLWRQEMENFRRYSPFMKGILWSPINYPHKSQWRRALISLCVLEQASEQIVEKQLI